MVKQHSSHHKLSLQNNAIALSRDFQKSFKIQILHFFARYRNTDPDSTAKSVRRKSSIASQHVEGWRILESNEGYHLSWDATKAT